MPKIPAKFPKYLTQFGDYVKTHTKNRDSAKIINGFLQFGVDHWEAFVESHEGKKNKKEAEKKPADPFKSLSRVMNKVAEKMEEADGDERVLSEYSERMREAVPDPMKQILADATAASASVPFDDLNDLLKEVSEGVKELSDRNGRILQRATLLKDSTLVPEVKCAENTLGKLQECLNRVQTHMTHASSSSASMEIDLGEAGDEDEENENEDQDEDNEEEHRALRKIVNAMVSTRNMGLDQE